MEKSYGATLPVTIQDEDVAYRQQKDALDRTRRRRVFFRFFATFAIFSSLYYYSQTTTSFLPSFSLGDNDSCLKKDKTTSSLESWLEKQEDLALRRILSNIGPAAGAADGVVIASPSKHDPDYYYTWTRDSALTISTLVPMLFANSTNTPPRYLLVEPLMRAYIKAQSELQALSNPSGDFWPGLEGLGEPKFEVDGTVFKGSWGRPQRDGPALRALAVIPYLMHLLERAKPADLLYIKNKLYDASTLLSPHSLVKADLEYVSHNWERHQPGGFDLWEEVQGTHYFGLMSSREAMIQGSAVARALGDTGAGKWYSEQAGRIEAAIENFWNAEGGYVKATLEDTWEGGKKRSSLDCAVPLGIMHGSSPETWNVGTLTDPASDKILASLRKYSESFSQVYPINEGKKWTEGIMIGRYPEDVYNGNGRSEGNPWYICTFAVAHSLRLAIDSIKRTGSITVTDISLPFWEDVFDLPCSKCVRHKALQAGITWSAQEPMFDTAIKRLEILSERYLAIGKEFVPSDGSMSEQIGKVDGLSKGASDLTWSYGSFYDLVAIRRRQRIQE